MGVLQLAAEADGEVLALGEGAKRRSGALAIDGAGEGEPAAAVRGLDDLGDDTTGRAEGGVQPPAGAGRWCLSATVRLP